MSEVEIKIRRQRPGPHDQASRGPLDIPRYADEGKRRLHPGIRFFDLGQIKSGDSWIDIPFNIKTGVTITHPGGPNFTVFAFSDFTLSNWNTLYSQLMAVPFSQWKNQYRLIEDNKYGVSEYQGRGGFLSDSDTFNPANLLQEDNPDWKTPRIKSINTWLATLNGGGLFTSFDTFPLNTAFKVTSVFDYSASSVSIDFKKPTDVFLIPQVIYAMALQTVGFDDSYIKSVILGHWTTMSRQLFLEKTAKRWLNSPFEEIPIFQGYGASGVHYKSNGAWMFSTNFINDTFATQLINWTKALPQAELFVQRSEIAGHVTTGFEPLANFPFAGVGPQTICNVDIIKAGAAVLEWRGVSGGVDGFRYQSSGQLRAVAIQGGRVYYIWRTGTGTAYGDSPGHSMWDAIDLRTSPET